MFVPPSQKIYMAISEQSFDLLDLVFEFAKSSQNDLKELPKDDSADMVKTYPRQNVPNQNVPNFGQNVPTFLVKTYPVYQNVPTLLVKTYPKYFSWYSINIFTF